MAEIKKAGVSLENMNDILDHDENAVSIHRRWKLTVWVFTLLCYLYLLYAFIDLMILKWMIHSPFTLSYDSYSFKQYAFKGLLLTAGLCAVYLAGFFQAHKSRGIVAILTFFAALFSEYILELLAGGARLY